MSAYIEQDSQFLTRRGIVVGAILALHVFIAWALATGLAHKMVEALAPPIQTVIQEEIKTQDQPPPPPPPQFERPPVEIPPSDTVIELPQAQTASTAISNTTTQHVAPVAAPRASVRTSPKVGSNFPRSDDYYPAASRRLNEEGKPVVHVCIGASGKLAQPPTIATSSGSARLDEGAINLVKAGARYISPGTEDGKPVDACLDVRIVFQLH